MYNRVSIINCINIWQNKIVLKLQKRKLRNPDPHFGMEYILSLDYLIYTIQLDIR